MGKKGYVRTVDSDRLTRGRRIWDRMLEEREKGDRVSLNRALLVTEAYRETEGLAMPLRRARVSENIATRIPIRIDKEQLLVGDFASYPMGFEIYPEFASAWIIEELQAGEFPYKLMDGSIKELREICSYWKDRSLQDAFFNSLNEDEMNHLKQNSEVGSYLYAGYNTVCREGGYHIPDYSKLIQKGIAGLLEEVEDELKKVVQTSEKGYDKANFLKGVRIALRECIEYSHRYARLAQETAGKTEDPKRKSELERIAEICNWVPEKPARTFYEAVQSLWFCHVFIYLESRCLGTSPGRMDQYLYPYYKRDIEEGRLTREDAIEILECLRPKMSSLRTFNPKHYRDAASGEAQYHNVTIGGQTSEGRDGTNEVSFLILEAALRARTPHHTITLRWHKNISHDLLRKAAEVVRTGIGFPSFYNDDSTIPMLIEHGATLEEARNYGIGGCVVPSIPGKTSALLPSLVNTAKCFEVALNDGIDPAAGNQVGPKTGRFEDFKSVDDLINAFNAQLNFACHEVGEVITRQRVVRRSVLPVLFQSSLIEDCIKKGEHAQGYGGKFTFGYMISVGMIDVVDSIAAIKKCVFEDFSIGKRELLEALKVNFKGKEKVLKLLLASPKYGNDDDYVDEVAAKLYSDWRKMVGEVDGPFGTKWLAGPYSVAYHGSCGRKVGALPRGREAGIALADGSVSACQGMDVNGPTAIIKSSGKIDQCSLFQNLFNLKFTPETLKTNEDIDKFLALIEVFFDFKGRQVQFNVIDRETLLDAQVHPEIYRNLIVRVAGFSALFTELNVVIQNEIIGRVEHRL